MVEDDIRNEARALAREAGYDADEILPLGDPEPVEADRGDGQMVTEMRRPLRARWTAFVGEARKRVQAAKGEGGAP